MPSSDKPTRRLAAIMFTDIAGYTEQMSKDEDKAFALIKKKRELLLPLVEKYEGKLIKEIGDGTLTSYFKADNAIDCASSFQSKTVTDLNIRAGIHTGEVIFRPREFEFNANLDAAECHRRAWMQAGKSPEMIEAQLGTCRLLGEEGRRADLRCALIG